MEQITWRIGEHLREVRNTRQMTLEDVAKLTGVSKPMLGQIERGQSSPTINTLWKISKGLKVPLSFFYRQQENSLTVTKIKDVVPITKEDGRMRLYPLYIYEPVRGIEVFYMELDGEAAYSAEPHIKSMEEYIFMVKGTLELTAGERKAVLEEKQALRFLADVPHVYRNCSDQLCAFYDVVFYGGS